MQTKGEIMWKWLGILVLVLVLGLAGGLYYLYSNLGSIVRVAIERYGSEATQSTVSVSSVTLKIESGEGAIQGIKIHNPTGFSDGDALQLGLASLSLDPQSVMGTAPIHIKEIVIDGPQVLYEQATNGGSNLDAIKRNVTAYGNKFQGGEQPSQTTPPGGEKKAERKLIIDDLYVKNGKVAVSAAALSAAGVPGVTEALTPIHLSNIGRAQGGATPAEVAKEVIGAISQEAGRVGATALTEQLVKSGVLGKNGSAIGGALKGLLGH
jgi:uncharacterized protein involved in outer membrane biogenesis